MKKEWRKHEKELYLPKNKPVVIQLPEFSFFTIKGTVNTGDDTFWYYSVALYALSYGIRMSYKWSEPPVGYADYTVYPLEGEWDLIDPSLYTKGPVNKDNLKFELMIRQPEFCTKTLFDKVKETALKKTKNLLINQVEFKNITEGKCLQVLHLGSYDDEPESFAKMADYCEKNGLTRLFSCHREIYLSDFRKVIPEKLKTVLRFKIKN